MPYKRPENRFQTSMNSLEDMISKQNPVRIIDLVVDKMEADNREEFVRTKESNFGTSSYLASTLLKLFLYGYFNGISSSRTLEKETQRNQEMKWLLGNLQPDHWTISTFRKDSCELIKKATIMFRKFLRSNEYMDFKKVAYDGTKVKANARKDMLKLNSIERSLHEIDKKIAEYLEQLKVNDMIDDNIEEHIVSGSRENFDRHLIDKIAILESQVEELNAYKKKMEEAGLIRISKSDEEAKLMKGRDGKFPGYNAQTVVDSKNHMIALCDVVNEEVDVQQLEPITEALLEEYNELPKEVLADKGYYNFSQIEKLELEHHIDVYVPIPESNSTKSDISFTYDSERDVYVCSEGKELRLLSRNKKTRDSYSDVYRGIGCNQCPRKQECTTSKHGRQVYRYINQEFRNNFKAKMTSKKGKLKTALRKTIVEHPFGTIKYLMGKIPILLRGTSKVQIEFDLYTTVYNLKRLINIEEMDILRNKIVEYNWKY